MVIDWLDKLDTTREMETNGEAEQPEIRNKYNYKK